MKAISLWQPHASLITLRLKRHETRSWGTNYRGPLLICSAKRNQRHQYLCWLSILETMESLGVEINNLPCWDELPFGYAIAVADLANCIKMTPEFIAEQTETERLVGDWQPLRFAWKLENIRSFANPIPVRGKQGLFDIDVDLKEELEAIA